MASNTNSKDTRRVREFASMVRNMSDSQVAEMIYSNDVQKYGLDLVCPCKSIQFHLKATPINRDGNGNALPSNPRPKD